MTREFVLPDLGEGIAEAQVIRLLVKEGEDIAEDQYLMEVETDKAAVEIPSPYAGVARNIHVKEGETINVGDVIVTFDDGGGAKASTTTGTSKKSAAPEPAMEAARTAPTATPPATTGGSQRTVAPAAPAVRKYAREQGVDLNTVSGSGPGGRITREDVDRHAAGGTALPAAPAVAQPAVAPPAAPTVKIAAAPAALPPGTDDSDKYGEVRRVPINQIRKTIANKMTESAYTAVHVTHGDEIDITHLERLRKQVNEATGGNPKMTAMTFVIRAVCLALKNHPVFNSTFDLQSGEAVYKKYINLGIAVDSDRGLVVPVIRNCDQLSMRGIAYELRKLADHIRANQFGIDDLRGGTFTITNVGALGGTFSTPIINYPEVAILGLGKSRRVPVFRNDKVEEGIMLPMNLSFDHRATDGANTARFAGEIKAYLENPTLFMLD
ncbi:MAG: dihydrolipoamide acetyltransferase family protein [Planctomycetota bacterium]|jgi:pyruvate/2-oxoglutarate dehydrogenase complex dihydrolipoamide acyltransferase (E2) component